MFHRACSEKRGLRETITKKQPPRKNKDLTFYLDVDANLTRVGVIFIASIARWRGVAAHELHENCEGGIKAAPILFHTGYIVT